MNVGDIVRSRMSGIHNTAGQPIKLWTEAVGIVLELGAYTGNCDLKIMWADGDIFPFKSAGLEVISESK